MDDAIEEVGCSSLEPKDAFMNVIQRIITRFEPVVALKSMKARLEFVKQPTKQKTSKIKATPRLK